MQKGRYSSRLAMQRASRRDFAYRCRLGSNRRVLAGARDGNTSSVRAPMKRFTVLGLIICLSGCTTMQPVTGNPSALQQRIASGELLKRGDDVIIRTNDGRTHVFSVKSVSASAIDGEHESVSIDQVALIQKRKLNVGETALAVGLGVVVVAAVVVVAVCCVRRYGGRSAGHAPRGHANYTQPLPPSLPPLQNPPQTPQLQTCAGPGSENKAQEECGGESAVLRWPGRSGDITPSRSAIPGFAKCQPGARGPDQSTCADCSDLGSTGPGIGQPSLES